MRTKIPGHAMRNDGGPFRRLSNKWVVWTSSRTGNGLCYCGAASPVALKRADRLRWYQQHLAELQGEVVEKEWSYDRVAKALSLDLITARVSFNKAMGQDMVTMPYSDLERLIAACANYYAVDREDFSDAFIQYLERLERLGGLADQVEASNVSGRV